jgi:hypothetical protein
MAEAIKRTPFLDTVTLERQAQEYGLAPNALERLVAMDRALRYVVASSAAVGLPADEIFGYALAGPAALLCVYIHSGIPLRLPDELTFAPVRRAVALSPADLAAQISGSLPGGASAPEPTDAECHRVSYTGTKGPGNFLLRVERPVLSMPPGADLTGAASIQAGYLYDPRLLFRPNFSAGFPVPVAHVEEIILRTLRALVMWAKRDKPPARFDDRVCRTDDLRLMLGREYDDTVRAVAGPVRNRLRELIASQNPPVPFEAWIHNFILALSDQVKRTCQTDAVPATLRPTSAPYSEAERLLFLERFDVLLDALRDG